MTTAALAQRNDGLQKLTTAAGKSIANANIDRMNLQSVLDKYEPALPDGTAVKAEADRYWQDYLAANRLMVNAAIHLQAFYLTYDQTQEIMGFGANCQ